MTCSGNDALARAAASAGLEIDWDIPALGGGLSGEDVEDGREDVHLGIEFGGLRKCGGCGVRWM